MSYYFLIIFAVLSINIFAQSNYNASSHVAYNVSIVNEHYVIDYSFLDYQNKSCSINWKLNKVQTDRDINKFGIPRSILNAYSNIHADRAKRERILKKGMFKIVNNTITVDKSAMINEYSGYTKVIANWIIEYLNDNDTRLNRIRMAMCFVQDIPYAIPTNYNSNWYFGGVIPAPNIFTCGYGDCDSKAILFAGILCHLLNPSDIRFAGEPNHVYTIIKDNYKLVEKGAVTYFKLDDGNYIIAETAGPGRLAFGVKRISECTSAKIEKIEYYN